MDSLNPVLSVGEQIVDTIRAHDSVETAVARRRAEELLEKVGLPGETLSAHAHQLSGGMRQRVGIVLALALEPRLLILDEPTTALDVIVEQEILEQIRELRRELGLAVLLITHDLVRMLQFSDRIAVLYAARLVELGPSSRIRERPGHPYTRGLISAFPSVLGEGEEPRSIGGSPPSLADPPAGCRFHPRCPLVVDRCRTTEPGPVETEPGHTAFCHLAE